jgi:hypothetical protein
MSNPLSFAQILQKKKITDISPSSRISASKVLNQLANLSSEVTSQYLGSAVPTTLSELMSEYTEFPERPDSNYILSFSEDNGRANQEF